MPKRRASRRKKPVWEKYWWGQPDQQAIYIQGIKLMRLDGLKEAVKPNIHRSRRLAWIFIFSLLTSGGGYMSRQAADEYFLHAVHYSRHGTTKAAQIPFMAMTICPPYLFKSQQLHKANEILSETNEATAGTFAVDGKEWTNEEGKMLLSFIHYLCEAGQSFFHLLGVSMRRVDVNLGRIGTPSTINDDPSNALIRDKVIPFVVEGIIDCSQFVFACFWNGVKLKDCSKLFRPVQTDVGMCCSFNSVPDNVLRSTNFTQLSVRDLMQVKGYKNETEEKLWSEWSMDNEPIDFPETEIDFEKFDPNKEDDRIPKRQDLGGRENGLSVVVMTDKKAQACPLTNGKAFLVAIHNPSEEPQMVKNGFFVPILHETFIKINTKLDKATDDMKTMDVNKRKCYLNSDNTGLKFFSKYTEENCQSECEARLILEKCKCVPLSLSAGNGTRICSSIKDDVNCNMKVKKWLKAIGHEKLCPALKCFPECNKLTHFEEVSSVPYQDNVEGDVRDSSKNIPEDKDFATIHAFNKDDRVDTEDGKKSIDFTTWFGILGGIFGLACGMSLISPFHIADGSGFILIYTLMLHFPAFRSCFEGVFGPVKIPKAKGNDDDSDVSEDEGENDPEAPPDPPPEEPPPHENGSVHSIVNENDEGQGENVPHDPSALSPSPEPFFTPPSTPSKHDSLHSRPATPTPPLVENSSSIPLPSSPKQGPSQQDASPLALSPPPIIPTRRFSSGRFHPLRSFRKLFRRRKTLNDDPESDDVKEMIRLRRQAPKKSKTTGPVLSPLTPPPVLPSTPPKGESSEVLTDELGPSHSEIVPSLNPEQAGSSSSSSDSIPPLTQEEWLKKCSDKPWDIQKQDKDRPWTASMMMRSGSRRVKTKGKNETVQPLQPPATGTDQDAPSTSLNLPSTSFFRTEQRKSSHQHGHDVPRPGTAPSFWPYLKRFKTPKPLVFPQPPQIEPLAEEFFTVSIPSTDSDEPIEKETIEGSDNLV